MNEETQSKISKLENQLMLIGLNGMAYTPHWNELAEELNILKGEK